jgi:hypothetical protein
MGGIEMTEFEEWVEERQKKIAEREAADRVVKEMTAKIGGDMMARGVSRHETDTWKIDIQRSERETVKKEKLLEQGVSWEQIEKATVKTPVESIHVRRKREE